MRRAEIARLLPSVFQAGVADGTPLAAALDAMEELHARPEARLATLDEILDPLRAPAPFVPFLARWVDLPLEFTTGLDRARATVASAAALARWRGCARGLLGLLEAATGTTGFEIDEEVLDARGAVRPFHVRVTAPAALAVHEEMLQRIIRLEKPAYVTHELTFTKP
ncbi:MAG TPA: phage tail protein [Anaeromyxobacter sp.]|nr:phage tail protein [Anaeromyxobacter sp.]